MRALVVEDHPEMRAELVQALEERGHMVTACASAECARLAWRRGAFPLVVLDWRLPGEDGVSFCRWLRCQPRGDEAVILMITGQALSEDLAAILDAGADDYLAKPFRLDLLRVRLTVAERQVAQAAERKALQDRLVHLAHHDALTGLPNRSYFSQRVDEALAARHGDGVALLFLDLDGFKLVNDSLGHAAGDRLLTQVAQRLAASVRPEDTVARFGGDEFTILPGRASGAMAAMGLAERLLAVLQVPFVLEDFEAYVGASIGIAVSVPGQSDAGTLLRDADVALYRAKDAGRGISVLFEPGMQLQVRARLEREAELRRAIDGELRLHYQPEVDLRTGRIVGLEALVRWEHPRLGLLGPGEFLHLAEETSLILPIGRWVLTEACQQARAWRERADGADVGLSVNVTARQLQQPDAVEELAQTLLLTGLEPAALKLEITEHAAVEDIQGTVSVLQGLRELGVRVAIDDFGVGYSSLGYVRELSVDTLKLDQSFIGRLGRDLGSLAVVRAVTSLAHALGIDVTAEGIESAEQLAAARGVGVDRGQGYYFADPVPAESVDELLAAGLPYERPAIVVGLSPARLRANGGVRRTRRAARSA